MGRTLIVGRTIMGLGRTLAVWSEPGLRCLISSSICWNLSSSLAASLFIIPVRLVICSCSLRSASFSPGIAGETIATADIPNPVTPVAITLRSMLPPYLIPLISYSFTVCTVLNCQLAAAQANGDGASRTLSLFLTNTIPYGRKNISFF
jgi:hypothetical protein